MLYKKLKIKIQMWYCYTINIKKHLKSIKNKYCFVFNVLKCF